MTKTKHDIYLEFMDNVNKAIQKRKVSRWSRLKMWMLSWFDARQEERELNSGDNSTIA